LAKQIVIQNAIQQREKDKIKKNKKKI